MRIIATTLAVAGLTALSACDVDQTDEGSLPDVDVNVSGGDLPEYNVQTEDVDIETEQQNVTVPTLEVGEDEAQ